MEANNGVTAIESNKPISKKSDYYQVISILCNEFGCDKIAQAMTYQKFYREFQRKNSRLFTEAFNMLSYHWQMGRSREYLESLALEVQYSLICYLSESQGGENHPLDWEIAPEIEWSNVA